MPDLAPVEARLRSILAPYRDRFAAREGDTGLILEMKGHEGTPWGFVAGTRLGARYVNRCGGIPPGAAGSVAADGRH